MSQPKKDIFFEVNLATFDQLDRALKKIQIENKSLSISRRQAFEIFLARAFKAARASGGK